MTTIEIDQLEDQILGLTKQLEYLDVADVSENMRNHLGTLHVNAKVMVNRLKEVLDLTYRE